MSGPLLLSLQLYQFWHLSTGHTTFHCKHRKGHLSLLAGIVFQSIKQLLTSWFLAFYSLPYEERYRSAGSGAQARRKKNNAELLKKKLVQAIWERDRGCRLFKLAGPPSY